MTEENTEQLAKKLTREHLRPEREKDPYMKLRQWLNIIFMVGAVVGMAVYFLVNNTTGTYIILASMIFKIVECVLRFLK